MSEITAKNVADFFILKGIHYEDEISGVKLQKLLYFAKGLYQAMFDKSLFPEKIHSWGVGPTVPEIHYEYYNYGVVPIKSILGDNYDVFSKFDEDQLEFLNDIWYRFGQFSSWKLTEIIREVSPCLELENGSVIEDEVLGNYFKDYYFL